MKGITPVIATVLLMTVTVGAAGTLYTIIETNQQNTANQIDTDLQLNTDQLRIEQCYNQSSNTYLVLRNEAQTAINSSNIKPLLNGTIERDYNTNPEIVNPQQAFTIEFNTQFGSNTDIILTDGDQQIRYSCYQL